MPSSSNSRDHKEHHHPLSPALHLMKRTRKMFWPWWKRQPPMFRSFLCLVSAFFSLIFLRVLFTQPDTFFIASESVHALGIAALLYKLHSTKNCAGLSLKSQELTAIFLAVRLYCSFVMEYNIHTLLDTATLLATCWSIYTIRFELRDRDTSQHDNLPTHYVVIPCAVLACVIHPRISYFVVNRVLWAFCMYLESVSVLPQLQVMRNVKHVEPFTAQYVFALGVARFLSFAHWVVQVVETRGRVVTMMGRGLWWPLMVLVAEVVQTGILADFCYYYVKSVMDGELAVKLPV